MNGLKRIIASVAITSACLLGCNEPSKMLVDDYKLERFSENRTYYYLRTPHDKSVGGIFDGSVEEIGWNNNWILARVKRLYQGDTNGWYALNLKTKQITGPIQYSDLKTNSTFSRIPTRQPSALFSN